MAVTQHWPLCSQHCCKMRSQSKVNLNTKRKASTTGKGPFPSRRVRRPWATRVTEELTLRPVLGLAPHLQPYVKGERLLFPASLPPGALKRIFPIVLLSQMNIPAVQVKPKISILACSAVAWDVSLLATEILSSSILKL